MKTKVKTNEKKLEQEILTVKLTITTAKNEKFIDELEKLCEKFSIQKDYFLKFQ